ncbi:MAG: peptidoglycan-binding domain-containing protein [Alphaproteobacteria bacterium]
MPPFFTLRDVVTQTRARPDDVVGVKRALNRMGFYDVPDYGMTPYADRTMFDGIRRFQRANGLRVDGVMQRGRATERAMNDGLRRASAERPGRPNPCAGIEKRFRDLQAQRGKLEKRLDNVNADILRAGGNLSFFAQRIVVFEGARLKNEILEISGKIHDLGLERLKCLKENK